MLRHWSQFVPNNYSTDIRGHEALHHHHVVKVKKLVRESGRIRAREPCESRGGRPGLPVPNSPYGLCGRKAVLKQKLPVPNSPYGLCGRKAALKQKLPVPNSPYGLCGRKAALYLN